MFEVPPEILQKQQEKKNYKANLETRFATENAEALEEQEAKHRPPVLTIPQCQTCNHVYRYFIESQLVKGRSYSAIARSLPPDENGHQLDRRSIAKHAKEHMPIDQALIRAEMEEEAALLGQNIEEGIKGAFTTRGALRTLIHKAYENAMSGVTVVEPRDLIQMVKVYNEMDANASMQATEEAKLAVRIMREAIENVLDEHLGDEQAAEMKSAIGREIKRLRSLDDIDVEIEKNFRGLPTGGSVPDAELVTN